MRTRAAMRSEAGHLAHGLPWRPPDVVRGAPHTSAPLLRHEIAQDRKRKTEALIREIPPAYLVWRSSHYALSTGPRPCDTALRSWWLSCPVPARHYVDISSAQRARRESPCVRGGKGMPGGPTSAPRPGSWPVLSIKHCDSLGEAFDFITWGCDKAGNGSGPRQARY